MSRRVIQLRLELAFPDVFELDLGDGIRDYDDPDGGRFEREEQEEFTPNSGYYSTGQGDQVYCFRGEEPDLTACDSECGYCGRCQY
jgi:hypothetical protein